MNILQIANKAIYPPDGGALAILSLSQGYRKLGHSVHLLNMLTHKHSNDLKNTKKPLIKGIRIKGIKINIKISFIKLILNLLFSKEAYIAERFKSQKFSEELASLIKNNDFDLIQIEGLYCMQYIHLIKTTFKGKIIYRPHNLEYLIWQRNASESKSVIKRYYFSILAKRLNNLELSILNTYDFIAPISQLDEQRYNILGNKKPIRTIPFGINFESLSEKAHKTIIKKDEVCYIGALDWIPNQNGLVWFIDKCLPIILKKTPLFTLNIAGRNAPVWLIKKFSDSNITFHGEVENAHNYLNSYGPMIVPLFSGSGMRVKIIEGMALKKSIIATKIACEGINCTNGKNILISDNPESFSQSILEILNKPSIQKELGNNAYIFVKDNFDNTKLAEELINFIK
ncbi:MAG: glycosyltransferase family 4 protein [Bacteroidales bacterium]|nr:glycosyltransferase family 4 protein [Bacteroidales bacterium]